MKIKAILSWVFVAFCAFMALGIGASGGTIGCILMLVTAALALPIRQVQEMWVRVLGSKPIEEVTDEPPAKFWQRKKKKEQKQRAQRIQNQKNRRAMKPLIIALVFMFAFLFGMAGMESSTSTTPSYSYADNTVIESESDDEPEETDSLLQAEEEEAVTSTPSETETENRDETEQVTDPEPTTESTETVEQPAVSTQTVSLADIPAYSGSPYVVVNDNVPYFTDADLTTTSYESYSDLDSLGRCGVAVANVGTDLMPTEERGSIGSVKPTGWHTIKYDCVDGKYLYNRCHLIGYQLTAENANTKNLITGTRYLNVEGMLPFENMVADYIQETGNHVLYRVTPIFDGDNLLANGVLMEAMSVEDEGDGVLFNVYCYNVQPGISIDYATGDSWEDESTSAEETTTEPEQTTEPETETEVSSGTTYILNTNTKKFHYPSCSSVDQMSDKNKQEYTGSREDLIAQGYEPCGRCNP